MVKPVNIKSWAIRTITSSVFWFFARDILFVTIISVIVGGFRMMMTAITLIAMIYDTIEYADWKTGLRAAGTVNAFSVINTKIATAIGGAMVGFIFASVHYAPNIVQLEAFMNGIRAMVSYIPSIGGLISLTVIMFYPLERNQFQKI